MLGLAVIGLLGLLISTTRTSTEIVSDAYAASLARSVYESVRVAARERSFLITTETTAEDMRGFLLVHEGVCDPVPLPAVGVRPEVALAGASFEPPRLPDPGAVGDFEGLLGSDFTILLPTRPPGSPAGPVFVFPRPESTLEQNRQGIDNLLPDPIEHPRGEVTLDVQRTYPLWARPLIEGAPAEEEADRKPDVADAYSFAVVIRHSPVPDLLDETDPTQPIEWVSLEHVPDRHTSADGLYLIEVLIYRGFRPEPSEIGHLPVKRYSGLLALGDH